MKNTYTGRHPMNIPIRMLSIVGLIAGLAAPASAQTILYSQDFSTNVRVQAGDSGNSSLPSGTGTGTYGDWFHDKATISGGAMNITTSGGSGYATRGTGFAIDGTGLTVAGDYTLSFNVTTANSEGMGVGIYAMNYGGSADYRIDTLSGNGAWVTVTPQDSSNTLTTLKADQMITGTGVQSITFSVLEANAGNDLVFLFSARSDQATARSTTFDDVVVTLIPEPGTYALLAGCLGLTWVMLRRRRS